MNTESKVDENSENVDKNGQSTEDSENLGEDDGIEPGELPSINESGGDCEVNVLEDILGADGGHDDLQKELDDSASKKVATPKTKKAKATPKRKSSRKTKNSAAKTKIEEVESTVKNKVESEVTVPKGEPKTSDEQIVKTEQGEKVMSMENKEVKNENISKSKEKPVKTKTANKKSGKTATPSQKASKPVNSVGAKVKTITAKVVKTPKGTSKTGKGTKKSKKEVIEKKEEKKEGQGKKVEETAPVEDADTDAVQEETLEKKEKMLEKMTAPPTVSKDTEKKEVKPKKEKSADRKRKGSTNPAAEAKAKKPKEVKSKSDKSEKQKEEQLLDTGVKEEQPSEEDMKVIDDVDEELSDHGSNYSHASSFSHSFSRSPSFSGSFTGSFSGSLSLSSFSGSNTSLDSLGKEGVKKKRKSRKHTDDQEHNEALQQHKEFVDSLLKGARYFIVKSNNHENVTLSKAKGVWATPPANERKLNDAYRHSTNVILVYSVKESGRFQGFARLASESRHDGIPVPWVLPPGFDRRILGGTFKIDWLNRKDVPFSQCANLRNPWNENKEVKICRDGQELEPSVGEVLCRMFEEDLTIDLSRVARHLKQRKKLGSQMGHKREYHPRFRGGGQRGNWRGGRGDFRGGFRGDRGRFGERRGGYSRDTDGRGHYEDRGFQDRSHYNGGDARYQDVRGRGRPNRYGHNERFNEHFSRNRSRSPEYRRDRDRESRERKHRDKVKEFLKNDKAKFGVRKETLLHGSYSDYVREFQRQKQIRSSSSYYPSSSSNHHHYEHRSSGSSRSHYHDPKEAAEAFLRRPRR
ncbi:YTH domain-containing protein 1-like [Hydractinia symbiolongicarpus]|uniref:YTH domain-containing protein 1-like n=1 Tax=Hydractinia symbiolongicarpus TaxID=13093 RepID=UPI00254B5646|nr:YTH domain-containing protein 1-like [Hydractinia symbiolongicarpus]XP_057298803.1 YTH domain-containing protein 1-like [Hydractinia symbiolongicarpus]